jgi:Sodium/calcium exchanger protein
LQRKQPMYAAASATHVLTAAFGVVMLGFVTLSLLLAAHAPRLFHLGVYSPMMLALYLLAAASVSHYERRLSVPARSDFAMAIDPHRTWREFTLAALVVVTVGSWLPELADRTARATGLSHGLVGTLMLAAATSLPELAVTLAALRLRAPDLAIANLLGSNLFNIAVLAIDDAVYLRGLFTEFALLLLICTLAGAVFVRLRQPVLIAYIVVGVAVGLKLDLHHIRHIGPVVLATGLGQLGNAGAAAAVAGPCGRAAGACGGWLTLCDAQRGEQVAMPFVAACAMNSPAGCLFSLESMPAAATRCCAARAAC